MQMSEFFKKELNYHSNLHTSLDIHATFRGNWLFNGQDHRGVFEAPLPHSGAMHEVSPGWCFIKLFVKLRMTLQMTDI